MEVNLQISYRFVPHFVILLFKITLRYHYYYILSMQLLPIVHCAGLLDVQNILSADNGISRQTEGDQPVLRHRVL
jgi:hypothetical protein